jgi:hypothetical protein
LFKPLFSFFRMGTADGGQGLGGDGGIRTLDRALQPYNGLANRRLQPLGHISNRADMPDGTASRKRQIAGGTTCEVFIAPTGAGALRAGKWAGWTKPRFDSASGTVRIGGNRRFLATNAKGVCAEIMLEQRDAITI